jgi:hypothetical protein
MQFFGHLVVPLPQSCDAIGRHSRLVVIHDRNLLGGTRPRLREQGSPSFGRVGQANASRCGD